MLQSRDAAWRKPPEALRGIDLRVAAGETVALVGETGAGKSTVMKLLARFYDADEGSVEVDGHDLRRIDLHEFRHQLGYVPQEAFLFSGTIRDNVAYGRPEASDAEVETAARAVGAHEFIARLSGGYHHELTERGRSLSSGQRQLIALARAELVDPVILLLDEATSNLDLVTEAHVAAAKMCIRDRRAHSLSTGPPMPARGGCRCTSRRRSTWATPHSTSVPRRAPTYGSGVPPMAMDFSWQHTTEA